MCIMRASFHNVACTAHIYQFIFYTLVEHYAHILNQLVENNLLASCS